MLQSLAGQRRTAGSFAYAPSPANPTDMAMVSSATAKVLSMGYVPEPYSPPHLLAKIQQCMSQ